MQKRIFHCTKHAVINILTDLLHKERFYIRDVNDKKGFIYAQQGLSFFSLGRTFVHLLTEIYPGNGELNIDSRTLKLLWRDKAPGISEKFKDLIDDLMEYEPRDRPKSTKEILKRINSIDAPATSFSPYIVYLSFVLNLVLLTLLAMGFTLNIGFKLLFIVVILVIADFLFLHQIQSLFKL